MSFSRRQFLVLSGVAAGASAAHIAAFSQTQANSSDSSPLYWPPTQALPSFPQAVHLDAADLTALDGDQQALLVTMQGIVNRTRPRLYFYWGTDPTNLEWLKTIGVPYTMSTQPWALFDRYRTEIAGAIIYDPNVPDTINLATTLAGIHGAVVATSALTTQYQLPVIEDLRGRFCQQTRRLSICSQ